MSRKIAVLIHVAAGDGRRHPVVGEDEIDPAFFGVFICLAGGSSRFSMAFALIVAYVGPSLFLDEGHDGGTASKLPLRSAIISFGPGSIASNCTSMMARMSSILAAKLLPFFAPVHP